MPPAAAPGGRATLPRLPTQPCILGATGGSGTRVFARILRDAGVFIGTHLAPSEDSLPFRDYFDRWTNAYIDNTKRWTRPAPELEQLLAGELPGILAEHGIDARGADTVWGWKAPRSIYFIPFWNRVFPDMRFIHVVRDGRDMAFSDNHNQVLRHSGGFLNPGEEQLRLPVRAMILWSRLNLAAAQFGENDLGNRYIRLRFEDLCREPVATAHRIHDFLGVGHGAPAPGVDAIVPPKSLGRWRNEDAALVAELSEVGREALRVLGYSAV